MERIKVNSNFYLDEFVDPHTYFNKEDNGLSLIDKRLFDQAQLLRYLYGKAVYINNWWKFYEEKKEVWDIDHIIKRAEEFKHINVWSGLRTDRCNIGSPTSAHRKGSAIDPKGNEMEFFNIVKQNAKAFYNLGLRRIESITITPGWLHMDLETRNQKKGIRIIDKRNEVGLIRF